MDVTDGTEIASSVYPYQYGVIDESLPLSGETVHLEPDWALQDSQDYIRTLRSTISALLKETGIDASDVVGVGIDFTACTIRLMSMIDTPNRSAP